MILERKARFNPVKLASMYSGGDLNALTERNADLVNKYLRLVPSYKGAMSEMATKLEVLDDEFSLLQDHNPIHHLEQRLKSPASILEKMVRKKYPLTIESLRENVHDIAGIRVICNYISDIYQLSEMLLAQDDVRLMRRIDYIANPKPSGYRSLHLIVTVPVHLSTGSELIPVEVQLRTVTMDAWACLEHELNYKTDHTPSEDILSRLISCANAAAELDRHMEALTIAGKFDLGKKQQAAG